MIAETLRNAYTLRMCCDGESVMSTTLIQLASKIWARLSSHLFSSLLFSSFVLVEAEVLSGRDVQVKSSEGK